MTSTTRTRGGFERGSNGVRTCLSTLLGIRDPKTLRIELGLSQPQMGFALGEVHPNGHGGRPFARCTISNYEIGSYRMTPETEQAYLTLLQGWVADKSGGRLAVKVRFGRTWRITPLMVCECGARFRFRAVTDRHCPQCRR